jgi:hypothetical protein
MSFKTHFVEAVNKFNTDWQVTREEAKKIKDVDTKISHVKKFLESNPSKANFSRVLNWTRMTKLGYKNSSPELAQKFENYLDYLEANSNKFTKEDTDTDLRDLSPDKFIAVYKDLVHRKNDFQHGGKRPASMVSYLSQMKEIASKRGINLPPDPQASSN